MNTRLLAGEIVERDVATRGATRGATPLARRIAADQGIDLDAIRGSGIGGTIVVADLGPRHAASSQSEARATVTPLFRVTQAAADSPIVSRIDVPRFHLIVRCNLDPLIELCDTLNVDLGKRGITISTTDMLIKTVAVALVSVPEANVEFNGAMPGRASRIDIAVPAGDDDDRIASVIRDVATLSLSAIARSRAGAPVTESDRDTRVVVDDLASFGAEVVVPPTTGRQALTLGIGAQVRRPWNVNRAIALATIVAVTGCFDRRAIGEATAGRFMTTLRELIEQPMRVLG